MTDRIRILGAAACLAAACVALSGCEDGRVRPPPTSVRVVHAAPTTGALNFLRESSSAAELDYRGSSSTLTFDQDLYDFNIDVTVPGAAPRRTSFTYEVLADLDYLFVLTESGGTLSPEPIIIATTPFESTTQTEAFVVHAAPALQAMDVYLQPPGTDLTTAAPLGNVAFRGGLDPAAIAPGNYELTLTAPSDPTTVLFSSAPITLDAGASNAFVIVDDAGDGLAPLSVVVSGPAGALLFDESVQSGVEVVNAAADGAARDVYLDGNYTAPLIPALAYPAMSALTPIPPGSRKLNVTPSGNTGVVEAEASFSAAQARRHTSLIAGEPGGLTIATVADDPRRVSGEARLRFMNGASQFTPLEFFLVPAGTDVTTVLPLITLNAPGVSQRVAVPPGDNYELVMRDADTDVVVAGPLPLTLGEGLYTVLAINGAASGTVDPVLLEDFN